jgi:hypothetical protein
MTVVQVSERAQRPHVRVFGGKVDIGAFEDQTDQRS